MSATFRATAAALSLLCLLVAPLFVSSELVGTILLSRHGTRAPNAVTVQLCPANSANFRRYAALDISLEGVTGRGMLQLYQLGQYAKQRYVDSGFLLPYYSNEQMYIRAVGEDRTLQSAVAWGQALYPAGHAPIHYRADVPSPLPVYTLPDELDTLLENRKAGCHSRLKDDVQLWDDSVGASMRRQYAALLAQLESLCGVNLTEAVNGSGDNYGDAVKDITDMWTFDFIEHFPPMPGLTLDQLLQFRTYAIAQLIGRILGTDEQVTYMNGDLPMSMLRSFQALIDQRDGGHGSGRSHDADISRAVKPLRFIAYHGHREMVYALAAFFDIRFNISYPALPIGAIPPATSIFFELHSGGKHGRHKNDDYVVKAVLWTPCDDAAHIQAEAPLVTADSDNEYTHRHNTSTHHAVTHNVSNHNVSHHHTPPPSTNPSAHDSHAHASASHPHADPTSASRASWTAGPQCGGRPVGIGRCSGGVCSFDEFRALIHEQISRTGSWHSLCHQRQHSDRYNHSASHNSRDDSDHTKVAGAGKTADHSPGYGATEGSAEEDKDKDKAARTHSDKHSHSHNTTHNGTATAGADDKQSSGSSGWKVLLWVLLLSAVIGGLGYWYFVVRPGNRDRSEYRPLPGRP